MDDSISPQLLIFEFRCFKLHLHSCIKLSTYAVRHYLQRLGGSKEVTETLSAVWLKSIREISSLQDIPWSSESDIITKWNNSNSAMKWQITQTEQSLLIPKSFPHSVHSVTEFKPPVAFTSNSV